MGVLKMIATDGHHDAADAVSEARHQYIELLRAMASGDWDDIAAAADVAYLAVGRLAALARAASEE